MMKLLSKISHHEHHLLVDFDQLQPMMKILDEHDILWKHRVSMGNCGWGKAPNCWFVVFKISDYKWFTVLRRFKEEGIELLPETIGY